MKNRNINKVSPKPLTCSGPHPTALRAGDGDRAQSPMTSGQISQMEQR